MNFRFLFFHKLLFILLFFLLQGDAAFSQSSEFSNKTRACEEELKISGEYINSNLDSALVHATIALDLAERSQSDELITRAFIQLGDVYSAIGDMDHSIENYLKAKTRNDIARTDHPEDHELIIVQSDILVKIGVFYFYLREYDKSIVHYEEAIDLLESLRSSMPEIEFVEKKLKIFNNIAGIHLQKGDYETALKYFQNAMELTSFTGNKAHQSSIANNIGICQMEQGDHDLADHYFLKALSIRTESGDFRGEAQVLNNLGKNSVAGGKFEQAKDYYSRALELGQKTGHGESTLISLESLSSLYDTLGDYKSALKTYRQFKTLNDSIYSSDSRAQIANLEDQYRRDKEAKIIELEEKRKEAEDEKADAWRIAIGSLLLFLLITSVLLIFLQRGKLKNSRLEQGKLQLENEKREWESRTLQENLEFRDRELTANALFLLKNNELISRITEALLKAKPAFKNENQQVIQDIIHELQASQNHHNWNEFEAYFTRVHASFYQSLQERFPDLTPNEKKLCAFLRLNMSTKDISSITYQSVNSITVARSRLRKKLNIEGEDIQLVNFLMTI